MSVSSCLVVTDKVSVLLCLVVSDKVSVLLCLVVSTLCVTDHVLLCVCTLASLYSCIM